MIARSWPQSIAGLSRRFGARRHSGPSLGTQGRWADGLPYLPTGTYKRRLGRKARHRTAIQPERRIFCGVRVLYSSAVTGMLNAVMWDCMGHMAPSVKHC